jgi:hypothetical protein
MNALAAKRGALSLDSVVEANCSCYSYTKSSNVYHCSYVLQKHEERTVS